MTGEKILPLKRKGFTLRDVASVFIRYEARCAKCHEKVSLGNYAIDHIQRLDALGAHTLENWQLLCNDCHGSKTTVDNREAKKGARVRGEKGQRARRAKHGPCLKSRNTFQPALPIENRESRSPDTWQRSGKIAQPKRSVLGKEYRAELKKRFGSTRSRKGQA